MRWLHKSDTEPEDSDRAKFHCPHAPSDSNYCICLDTVFNLTEKNKNGIPFMNPNCMSSISICCHILCSKNPFYDFHSMFRQFDPSVRSTLHRVTFAFVDRQVPHLISNPLECILLSQYHNISFPLNWSAYAPNVVGRPQCTIWMVTGASTGTKP